MIAYKKLRIGDVRQEGDEVERLTPYPSWSDKDVGYENGFNPVKLIGHKILASDLMNSQFRRKVEVAEDP